MPIANFLKKIYLEKIKGLSLPRDLVRYAVKRNYHKIAVIDGQREITYGQLYERAKKLASALLGQGLKKGDRLAILIYNCQEYFEIRAATYLTGIVLVPMVWDMCLEDIIFVLNDCRVETFIYHPRILADKLEIIRKNTPIKIFIPILTGNEKGSYEDLLSLGEPFEPRIELYPDDIASVNFSSGTTARPKGIILLQRNWISSFYGYVLNSRKAFSLDITMLHLLSFATSGSTVFLSVLFLGVKNIILEKFNLEDAIGRILQYKVNILGLSPSLLVCLLEHLKQKGIKIPMAGVVVGTEVMPQEKLKEAIEFFGPLVQEGYGMAEVLPPLSLLCSRDYLKNGRLNEDRLLSVGRPLSGVRMRVVDERGRRLPCGKTGRIAVKSPSCSKGYWNNAELTKRHYKEGWFYSNDFGYQDKGGYVYILGRKEDIVRESEGKIVFARQVEEVLHKHSAVLEAYVFADEQGRIFACVSPRESAPAVSPDELVRFCAARLEKYQVPEAVRIYPELPKNANGKLDRGRIKRECLQGQAL